MEKAVCSSCQKPKANLACGICASSLCKHCARGLDESDFDFLTPVPKELAHDFYCGPCYDAKVAPALADYYHTVDLAKSVFVFTKDMGKEARLIKRKEAPVRVEDCPDHDETVMRLAFLAAKGQHNALVDVVISDEKVRNEGYQTTRWSGVGVPATIDARRYEKRRELSNPN